MRFTFQRGRRLNIAGDFRARLLVRFPGGKRDCSWSKVKSHTNHRRPTWSELIPVSERCSSMKHIRVLPLPPWMGCYSVAWLPQAIHHHCSIYTPGPVCSKHGLANPGLASIFNSLSNHNDVDSNKLFSRNNLTLAGFKLSPKIIVILFLKKRIRNLGQHLTRISANRFSNNWSLGAARQM